MAAKQKQVQVPAHAKTGVWINILDALFPLTWITTKFVTEEVAVIKRGKIQVDPETGAPLVTKVTTEVPVKTPFFALIDHRETERRQSGYNRLKGRLCAEGSTRDDWTEQSAAANRKVLGDTYAIVNGTVIPLTLEFGVTAKGKPKFDIPGGQYVEIGDDEWVLHLGVSQTFTRRKPYVLNGLYVWADFTPYNPAPKTERVEVEVEANLTDASSLFANV